MLFIWTLDSTSIGVSRRFYPFKHHKLLRPSAICSCVRHVALISDTVGISTWHMNKHSTRFGSRWCRAILYIFVMVRAIWDARVVFDQALWLVVRDKVEEWQRCKPSAQTVHIYTCRIASRSETRSKTDHRRHCRLFYLPCFSTTTHPIPWPSRHYDITSN